MIPLIANCNANANTVWRTFVANCDINYCLQPSFMFGFAQNRIDITVRQNQHGENMKWLK
jgi:hypothetical protein